MFCRMRISTSRHRPSSPARIPTPGQRCTAVKRILAGNDVADRLIPKLLTGIKKLKVGDPRDNATIVPLINEKAADYVMELIEDAQQKGAAILTGGNRKGDLIEPTLVDHVTTDMRLAWEEPFGPVLPIVRVKDIHEAVDIANRSEYGPAILGLYQEYPRRVLHRQPAGGGYRADQQ